MALMLGENARFIPLSREVMEGIDGHVLEGVVQAWGPSMSELRGMVLTLKGSRMEKLFTHSTLFEPFGRNPYTTVYVRVSLNDGKLKLECVDPDYSKVIENSTVLEADPVVLSSVSLDLVLKLVELTHENNYGYGGDGRCMRGEKCQGARQERLDFYRTALVMPGGHGFSVMCRQCCREAIKADPRVDATSGVAVSDLWQLERDNVPLVVLKGWELTPHAPVTTWNFPSVRSGK